MDQKDDRKAQADAELIGSGNTPSSFAAGFRCMPKKMTSSGRGIREASLRNCPSEPQFDDAVAFAWTSVRLGLMIFGVVGLLEGVVFRRPLIEFISQSPAVRDAMMTPMLIMGIVTPLISVALILSEALFGAGETKFVAGAQGLLVFGWLVPGAWFLGVKMNMGLNGIFTAACVYAVLASVTMTIKFRGGAWKKIVI